MIVSKHLRPCARWAAIAALTGLAACAGDPVPGEQPAFYRSMASADAQVDGPTAASMISGYRHNNGLGTVEVDPELMRLAYERARAMAAKDKLDRAASREFNKSLADAGFNPKQTVENISAGYHTLAEAFSGWRDSPPHRANMLDADANRLGIAAVYSPQSKYKVFWALIMANKDSG
ncbi:MAG: CAP domain-containing protein [Xanthobacteraceae bacterium]|nr:CAP domain-containing protein [Xanthobacteraceae bacterium]